MTKRQKVLANDEAFAALKEAIGRLTSWKIIAAVLMPDHVHLLLGPVEREAAVGNASGAIKRFVAPATERALAMAAGQLRSLAPVR